MSLTPLEAQTLGWSIEAFMRKKLLLLYHVLINNNNYLSKFQIFLKYWLTLINIT